ncbi:MAG: protein phosphatase CheZ [Pseudolabrys sp.]|nr:protein phosphatase CheZ [Pseudolabrys sp.]
MADKAEDQAVQRKAFRIESMLTPRRNGAAASYAADVAVDIDALSTLRSEIAAAREAMARNRQDLTALVGDAKERRLPRAAAQLGAAVDDMRSATDQILNLAEAADDNARALAASLKDDYKRGLAQEIQDQIVKIYEACNFQDIAGQHIGKVISLLGTMEGQLDAIIARSAGAHREAQPRGKATISDGLLNGPKLASDTGHATQHDVDRIFG